VSRRPSGDGCRGAELAAEARRHRIPLPDEPPRLTFQPGGEPGTIDIGVGWGWVTIPVTASIEDGKLKTDCEVPVLGDEINTWVDNLNADLEANGKQLSDLAIRNGKLHLAKQPIAGADAETAGAVNTDG
jgi:hypothetical protein